jgi:hypothetical protein
LPNLNAALRDNLLGAAIRDLLIRSRRNRK